MTDSLLLQRLTFTGPSAEAVEVSFPNGLNFLYGASNTGKSFTVKAIDFAMGASSPLPEIEERDGYDQLWLSLIAGKESVTLSRSLAGGGFELWPGAISARSREINPRALSPKHDATSDDNVSQFLLRSIGLSGKRIAIDANGKKRSLSFRDISKYCIVDETSVQSEMSPIHSGQNIYQTAERSVFKLLVSGIDDSSISEVIDRKTFKASTSAKIEIIDELLASLSEELSQIFPNADDLKDQEFKIEATLDDLQKDYDLYQQSMNRLMREKRENVEKNNDLSDRLATVSHNLSRFQLLNNVYTSDIARLESLEEAGFLLTLQSEKDCPLCGATSENQRDLHGSSDIVKIRTAALAEIEKIKDQSRDLLETVRSLNTESEYLSSELLLSASVLLEIEAEIESTAPVAADAQRRLSDIVKARDTVKRGRALSEQRASLIARRAELEAQKPASKSDKPKLGVSSTIAHDFSQTVSSVLEAWHFPGDHHVAFDDTTYDLRIDGKHRRFNGKGVRAVTHTAFKVALMIFCHERGLPHPGFLVIDTPLLTYRDPMDEKYGELSEDEEVLAKSDLKGYFFEHLSTLKNIGQFVVVENVDPPAGIEKLAHIEAFHGLKGKGRKGLFSPKKPVL